MEAQGGKNNNKELRNYRFYFTLTDFNRLNVFSVTTRITADPDRRRAKAANIVFGPLQRQIKRQASIPFCQIWWKKHATWSKYECKKSAKSIKMFTIIANIFVLLNIKTKFSNEKSPKPTYTIFLS